MSDALPERRLLWLSLPDQRPRRELSWLSRMPRTHVTALAADRPVDDLTWVPARYVRPVRRFVEAGALAWARDLDRLDTDQDWVATLELCSLVSGQAARWARRNRVRQAVLTWENLVEQPLYRLPPYREAFRRSLDADLFLCLVHSARRHLLEHGVDDDRIRVVHPGVDTEVFQPAPEPVAEPVAAFVSPLARNKGIDTVLAAMQLVRHTMPEARLVVMGSGPLEPLVRRAAEADAGITVMAPGGPQRVAEVMRSASVFVTAPRATWKWTEQFGLAYVEAAACGLPVVSSVCGSNDEAAPPPNLLTANSAEAVADGLLTLFGDASRRRDIGRANRQRVLADHHLDTQCAAMGAVFETAERHGRPTDPV